jgi:peptidoglycan/LPS O-acetylase OafA/YrhL
MNYRADIDGLRAIAVLAVVIFHLGVPGFEGGYIGVDVFFVISGFLITSILKNKYEAHNFSLSDFYFRRIRRLIPPLIATVMATFIAAALIMTPQDMIRFSRSTVASLFSVSNIAFYLEAGYWDTASKLKPLLHTWSLGVEEQFYLFWPLLIIGLLKLKRRIAFSTSLMLISAIGTLLFIGCASSDQSAAFYLLPFRVFQFAIGALIIPLLSSKIILKLSALSSFRFCILWLGLGLVALSIFAFDESTLFLGSAVLIPTVGAAAILLAAGLPGPKLTTVRLVLENPLSLWLGRTSYSLYLVHWPLIALYHYRYELELSALDQVILALVILLCTVILHYGVERRFYQRASAEHSTKPGLSNSEFSLRTLGVLVVVVMFPLSAWLGDGWSWRFPSISLSPTQIRDGQERRFLKSTLACTVDSAKDNPACNFTANTQVLIMGNSHEPDGFNFINAGYGGDDSINLIMFGNINPCTDLRREEDRYLSSNKDCQNRLDSLFDTQMLASLDIVVYAANKPFAANKNHVFQIFESLKSKNTNLKIITLGGYINTKRDCVFYINESNSTRSCRLPKNVAYFESDPKLEPLYTSFSSIQSVYIDRVELLCKNRELKNCTTQTERGVPMFYDAHHHSLEFAEMAGRKYAKQHPNLFIALDKKTTQ